MCLGADGRQLAKASTLALFSMLVIIVTVITQGVRVPADLRGNLKGSLFIRDGIFQAIGVISFGRKFEEPIDFGLLLISLSICVPYANL